MASRQVSCARLCTCVRMGRPTLVCPNRLLCWRCLETDEGAKAIAEAIGRHAAGARATDFGRHSLPISTLAEMAINRASAARRIDGKGPWPRPRYDLRACRSQSARSRERQASFATRPAARYRGLRAAASTPRNIALVFPTATSKLLMSSHCSVTAAWPATGWPARHSKQARHCASCSMRRSGAGVT